MDAFDFKVKRKRSGPSCLTILNMGLNTLLYFLLLPGPFKLLIMKTNNNISDLLYVVIN